MSTSDSQPAADKAVDDLHAATTAETDASSGEQRPVEPVAYLPAGELSADDIRQVLRRGNREARREMLAELLRYAPWEELWDLLSPAQVRADLPHLELPESLAKAWRTWLETTAPTADDES